MVKYWMATYLVTYDKDDHVASINTTLTSEVFDAEQTPVAILERMHDAHAMSHEDVVADHIDEYSAGVYTYDLGDGDGFFVWSCANLAIEKVAKVLAEYPSPDMTSQF